MWCRPGEVGFRPWFVGVDGVRKYFWNVGSYPHRMRRNARRLFAGLCHHRVSLALRAVQPLNDKLMLLIDDCRTIVRGWVDPREKSVIVAGLSRFPKRAHDSISSHGGFARMSAPQLISERRMWLGFHVVRSGVDTGGPRDCSRVLEL